MLNKGFVIRTKGLTDEEYNKGKKDICTGNVNLIQLNQRPRKSLAYLSPAEFAKKEFYAL